MAKGKKTSKKCGPSEECIQRIHAYIEVAGAARRSGQTHITASSISNSMTYKSRRSSSLIRKDLTMCGLRGIPQTGFQIDVLIPTLIRSLLHAYVGAGAK